MDATTTPAALRLALELRRGAGAPSGSLIDESGAEQQFSGWLGLLTLLEAKWNPQSSTSPS
jgi:hypothetical protein